MKNKIFNAFGKNIQQMKAALIEGENYIRFREFEKLGIFKATYDAKTKTSGLELALNDIAIEVDGEEKTVKGVNIGGYNYALIRSLITALGNMKIDYKDRSVIIRHS